MHRRSFSPPSGRIGNGGKSLLSCANSLASLPGISYTRVCLKGGYKP